MAAPGRSPDGAEEIDLLDKLRRLWRYRRMIALISVVGFSGTLIATLMMPKEYEAVGMLLAPQEGAGAGLYTGLAAALLGQQFGPLSVPPGISLGGTPIRDMMVSILKSRTVAESVVRKFNLQERYGSEFLGDAIEELDDSRTVSITREGSISVKVEAGDPQLAADITNYHLDEVDRLVNQYGISTASRQRVFLAAQLERSQRDLQKAEEDLRQFQERNGAIVLHEQTRGAIEAAARLKGELIAGEVQLQVMRSFATDSNPEILSLKRRLDEMRRQLGQMQYGNDLPKTPRDEIFVPVAKVPQLGLELARLTRDVKAQEVLVTVLATTLEQAKLAEAKDMPLVQVLDRAVAPERPSRPRVVLLSAVAGVLSVVSAVLLATALDSRRSGRAAGHASASQA
jgi:tyrosine-protein kinase Etk/Wzc